MDKILKQLNKQLEENKKYYKKYYENEDDPQAWDDANVRLGWCEALESTIKLIESESK